MLNKRSYYQIGALELVHGASGVYNDGAIVGHGISAENDCYTSQLNITFTDGL